MSPAITIVTPLPQPGEQFAATARAILNQSLSQWEWLIVGDPTTVPPLQADPRIRVLDASTQRASVALNAGAHAARAPFVIFLESGDLLEPSALEKMAWLLTSFPEYAFVTAHSAVLNPTPRLDREGFPDTGRLLRRPTLVRREAFATVGDFDETLDVVQAEQDFWGRCAAKGLGGSTVKEFLSWLPGGEERGLFRGQSKAAIPDIQPRWHQPYDAVPNELPFVNPLQKARPRALLLLPWLTMGGSDKFNLDLIEQLTRCQGYEVSIVTTNSGDQSRAPLYAQFTPDIFILQNFLKLVDYPRFIRYLIESRQIDVVLMSHSTLSYQLLPYLRAHCRATAFVDYCHIEEEQWQNGGYPRASVSYGDLLDLAIVSSQHLKNWMIARGGDSTRIEVCHTNIDPQLWTPDPTIRARVRRELSIPGEANVVFFAGRLCDQKQPCVLGETLRQLHKNHLEFVAIIAGDGEERAWLERFVRQHQLSAQIRLLGAASYDRVRELMGASDVFFLPSKWEGIALGLFEAMACALPVVSADVGGQRELVTEECGILLPRVDETTEAPRYAEALAELLRDPSRRMALGKRARQRILEHFQLDDMGQRMAALFEAARKLQATQPREVPSRGLGLACATEAIEFTRLSGVAEWLWKQQNGEPAPATEVTTLPRSAGANLWTRLGLTPRSRRRVKSATSVVR